MAESRATVNQRARLRAPRHWPSWAAVGVAWLLTRLPYRLQMAAGRALGDIAYYLVASRRRVASINLALCFPKRDAAARHALLRAHFRSVGMGAVETGLCWWARPAKIQHLAHIEGRQHLEAAALRGRGIVLLSAHFTSLELGVRLAGDYLRELGYNLTAVYKPPHDPVIEHVMRTRREAHIGGAAIGHHDIGGMLAALKRGDAVWYAGDQKPGRRASAIADFFGQPARTHVAVSHIARVSRASVVPFFTLRDAAGIGYRLIVMPALADFPSADTAADAARVNALIESVVVQAPAQYFWLHQRFKRDDYNPYRPAADGA